MHSVGSHLSFPIALRARFRISARVSLGLTTIAAMSCNAVSNLFSREVIPLLRVCFVQLLCVVFISFFSLGWVVVWDKPKSGTSAFRFASLLSAKGECKPPVEGRLLRFFLYNSCYVIGLGYVYVVVLWREIY